MADRGRRQARDPLITYRNKVEKITNWYNNLLKNREKEIINPNTKKLVVKKPLKPLDWYIAKIKRSE